MKKIAVIFGTRPEAIKLSPLIIELRKKMEVLVCSTGQHASMLEKVLDNFALKVDTDLGVMKPRQSLAELTSKTIMAIDDWLEKNQPDIVLVQGDTTSAYCAALTAFYRKISVGHVEAGLRTGELYAPFPEEINRKMITTCSTWHFAPTAGAAENLRAEGVSEERIFLTGNTVIDALLYCMNQNNTIPPVISGIADALLQSKLILVTCHRRETFGEGLKAVCEALALLAERFPDITFVFPVHRNPQVKEPVTRYLSGRKNIFLIDPLDYRQFVFLMSRSMLILTDSGGVQEEAPTLGVPVVVIRSVTERPEAVKLGTAILVGIASREIIETVSGLLENEGILKERIPGKNPFGDGRACERIAEILERIK